MNRYQSTWMRSMRMGRLVPALLVLCSASAVAQHATSMFVFRDNFWLNLHQFLRGEVYRRHTNNAPGVDTTLSDSDKVIWNRAVDAYGDLAKRDVLFDELLRGITNVLTAVIDTTALPDSLDGTIGTSTRLALNAAAPVYRRYAWPARERDNEAWIATAKALVARHGAAMSSRLASIYQVRWPAEPILVDVVGEVGPNSAITYGGAAGFAAHIQASASSRRNAGDAPLELLFHEAAHAAPVESRIRGMVEAESAHQHVRVPDDLWHSMIMFTSGIVARDELARVERRDYVPYAERYNQLTPAVRKAIERDWQPYVEGKATIEKALHDLVRDSALP